MRTARGLAQLDSGSSCVSFCRDEANGYESKNDGHEQPRDRDPYSEHPDDREKEYPAHERRNQDAPNLCDYHAKALQHRCPSNSITTAPRFFVCLFSRSSFKRLCKRIQLSFLIPIRAFTSNIFLGATPRELSGMRQQQ